MAYTVVRVSLGGGSMGQAIKGKGVVVGKAAIALKRALENPKPAPEKVRRLEEAIRFHTRVRVIK